jgi:hypothetical protein
MRSDSIAAIIANTFQVDEEFVAAVVGRASEDVGFRQPR